MPLEDEEDLGGPPIADDEQLLRRVHPAQVKSSGEPDSSIFKDDPGGQGTSLTAFRSAEDIARVLGGREGFGVVAITAKLARAEGLCLKYTFEEGNPNHVEMCGPRTSGKQKRLRAGAIWIVPMP